MDAKTWDVGLPRDFAMVTSACTEAKEGPIFPTSLLLMLFKYCSRSGSADVSEWQRPALKRSL